MYEFLTLNTTMNKIKLTMQVYYLFIVVLTVRNSYIYGIHNRMQSIKIVQLSVEDSIAGERHY
jgi:hypothetical protein